MRAHTNDAVCILGSATPSLESYVNATETGKYTYLSMPERVPVPGHTAAPLPGVRIIDLTLEKRKHRLAGVLSEALKQALSERLATGQQAILLQNRRGYSSILLCQTCGWSPMCSDCAVTLTYHKVQHHLRCHYCGKTERISRRCPQCGGTELSRLGAGTQRIEEELEAHFPQARLARMDLDTTSGKNAHFKILDRFARGESDILIGTQMVAKGLDFGNVTLVGVVNADVGMLLPDFRAEERTFQLLTQVAGRAGRANLRGEVLLQTRNPSHPVLRFASQHDYDSFARIALAQRRELHYPPYGRVVRVEFKGPQEDVVQQLAQTWTSALLPRDGIQVMGPQAAFIGRIQKMYRFHVILKALRHVPISALRQLIEGATEKAGSLPRDYRMAVDVDAISLF
jgi:primosomal protein N' (replication factor Y)